MIQSLRLGTTTRAVVAALVALALATPASAQFGSLKKNSSPRQLRMRHPRVLPLPVPRAE